MELSLSHVTFNISRYTIHNVTIRPIRINELIVVFPVFMSFYKPLAIEYINISEYSSPFILSEDIAFEIIEKYLITV